MILPFGKHKGFDTSDLEIPLSYILWLEEQDWIKDDLRKDLNIEIEKRKGDRSSIGKDVKIQCWKDEKKTR